VSFSVKSGQLVVIVGTNGSGKSTVVKILNRLYNPTSGEILVDGQPMSSYQTSGLRQATADLSQDHHLYPLSIRENIGLGHTHSLSDIDLITKSAELGGALDFVTKLDQGFDTTLRPVRTAYMGHASKGDGHPLKYIFDNLEKQVDISGAYITSLLRLLH
jgi:ABC-type multidrug transport system fused ATPase/permease subunit